MIGKTNVGGSGLLESNAILRVAVPTGATVTATKSGKTLKPKMWTQNADNTSDTAIFSVPSSTFDSDPWTVTATLSTDTATDTIIIDSANEYDLILAFRVPSGYQAVEYIQSSGAQYINTTIPAQFCSIDAQVYATYYQEDAFIITSVSSSPRLQICDTNGSNTRLFYNGNSSSNILYGTKMPLNEIVSIQAGAKPGSQYVTVNGTSTTKSMSSSPSLTGNFALLRGYSSTSDCMRIRLYYLKVYDTSDTLIGELYPCYRISDSVAGLWDRVNKVFLTNAGSGSFSVGGDI